MGLIKTAQPALHGDQHLRDGSDPIPNLLTAPTGGDTLDQLILAAVPDGFWKLNESSGSIANDSSGFGQDMSTTPPEVNPLWAQPPGPPGQQTADFETGSSGMGGTGSRVSRSWPALNTDFTAGIWASRNSTNHSHIMGQGNPDRSGGKGWQLGVNAFNESPFDRPMAVIKTTTSTSRPTALNALAADTWAFLALTYNSAAGEWKLYVEGLLNDTKTGVSYSPVTSPSPLWIGHDGGLGSNAIQPSNCTLSYGFLINRTLTGSELLAMAESTTVIDRTGYVLTLDDSGTPYWAAATIEVDY